MSETENFYALLVGINIYKEMSALSGCINDVNAFTRVLQDKFQVPKDNLKHLLDTEATYANIKTAFRAHLIDRAKAWTEAGKPEPMPKFLFVFCGHGSQATDPTQTKPGGMDETLAPHDASRQEGVDTFDIKDWELGLWIDELAEWGGDNITIVLDCCHSGSGTRAGEVNDTEPEVRFCPPDTRPQPYGNPNPQPATRGIMQPPQNHVLLAACLNTQKAHEYKIFDDDNPYIQGVMSYFLVSTLSQIASGKSVTYSELHRVVADKVKQLYRNNQTPQCEGDTKRELFGGLCPAHDNLLYVTGKEGAYILINGGMVQGLDNGALLRVYPPGTRTLQAAGDPLAVLSLEHVDGTSSRCLVQEGDAEAIEIHSAVAIVRYTRRRLLYFDVQDSNLQAQLEKGLCEFELAACLAVTNTSELADFTLRENDEQLTLYDAANKSLVTNSKTHSYSLLLNALHIARYRNALELKNLNPSAPLQGKLTLQLTTANPLPATDNGLFTIAEKQDFCVEMTNHSDKPLYFGLLAFDKDWSVTLVYPELKNTQEHIKSGERFSHFFGYEIEEADKDVIQVTVKVIASTEPAHFEWLEQGKLGSHYATRGNSAATGLDALLQEAMSGSRGMVSRQRSSGTDKWITAQMAYQVVRRA